MSQTRPSKNLNAYLQIHLAVLLFGGASLFGKWIQLPATGIVLGRTGIAFIFLFVYLRFVQPHILLSSFRQLITYLSSGFVLAFHWFAFFHCIKLTDITTAVLTFSTFPVFTSLLEPIFFKSPFSWKNILLSLICVVGVYIIAPIDTSNTILLEGFIWGLLSGLSFSILALLNKAQVQSNYSLSISMYQNLFACLILCILFPTSIQTLQVEDMGYLLVLGIVFTGVAHSLFIQSLQSLTAQTSSIIASLEPIYAIGLAYVFFQDRIELNEWIGGGVILLAVFLISYNTD